MAVAVITPWRGGCPHRERAADWVSDRFSEMHPDWRRAYPAPPEGPWVKALAVMPAIEACCAEIVVVADADVWSDGILDAVFAVRDGAAWAMPHGTVYRLTEIATARLVAGGFPDSTDLEEKPYPGMFGGGIVVARRETLLDIPLDPRFVGWGQEDTSWAIALHHLAGRAWRGDRPLWHLYHPPQPRLNRKRGSEQSWNLYRRYCAARGRPAHLRQIVEEAKGALESFETALHDHAA